MPYQPQRNRCCAEYIFMYSRKYVRVVFTKKLNSENKNYWGGNIPAAAGVDGAKKMAKGLVQKKANLWPTQTAIT